MGIRAHLITEYRGETFSLGEDRVMEILENEDSHLGNVSIDIDESGCGMIMMELCVAIQLSKDKKVDQYTRVQFIKDIKWARKNNDGWLKYYCY